MAERNDITLIVFVEEEPTVRELGNFLQMMGALDAIIEWGYGPNMPLFAYLERLLETPEEYGSETELNAYERDALSHTNDFDHEVGYEMALAGINPTLIADMVVSGRLNVLRDNWEYFAYDADDRYSIDIEQISSGSPILLTTTAGLAAVIGTGLLMNHENKAGDRTVFVEGRKVIHRISNLRGAVYRGKNLTGKGSSSRTTQRSNREDLE